MNTIANRAVPSLLVLASAAGMASAQISFIPFGPSPGTQPINDVSAVSSDGNVAVGSVGPDAWRWTRAQGYTLLTKGLNINGAFARSVNADGRIIGGGVSYPQDSGHRFRVAGGLSVNSGPFDAVAPFLSDVITPRAEISGLSDSGDVYAASTTMIPGFTRGYVINRNTGVSTELLAPNGARVQSPFISKNGQRVAAYTDNGSETRIRYWDGPDYSVSHELFPSGAPVGYDNITADPAIGADGSVIAGTIHITGTARSAAFVWTQNGPTRIIEGAPDESLFMQGMNADASVLLLYGSSRPYLWTASGGLVALDTLLTNAGIDLTGWTLQVATDLSSDGQTLVGFGIDPQGVREGFMVALPAPGTAPVLLMLFAARRRRR